LAALFLLTGCVEERIDIVLNADGSGRVRAEIVESSRLMTAYHEIMRMRLPVVGSVMGIRVNAQAVTQVVQRHDAPVLEEALNVYAYERRDLWNGGRRTRYSGTFGSLSFLDTNYARETLGLRWLPRDAGGNVLYIDIAPRDLDRWAIDFGGRASPEPTLRMLFGLFQGYRRNVRLHLPFPVEDAPAADRDADGGLHWDLNLRDARTLEEAEKLDALCDAGRATVMFATDALPGAYRAARAGMLRLPEGPADAVGEIPEGMMATLRQVQVTRSQLIATGTPSEPTQVMFEWQLQIPESLSFMQHLGARVFRAEDEEGESVITALSETPQSGYRPEAGGHAVYFYAQYPQRVPGALSVVQGVLPVAISESMYEVRLGPEAFRNLLDTSEDVRPDVPHEMVLTRLDTNAATFQTAVQADERAVCRVASASLMLEDGTYEEAWASRPRGNTRSVSFRTPILEAEQVVVTLVKAYSIYEVPFLARDVRLP
jgi:hypothetical protein